MRIAISGTSGFLGRFLSDQAVAAGHTVRPMVRVGRAGRTMQDGILWDPERGTLDPAALRDVDAVVHLAGEAIDHRWTEERKHRIWTSRIRGTTVIAKAVANAPLPKPVLLSGSAIGVYGDRGDEVLDEASSCGGDFLARVAVAWEEATSPAADAGARVVLLRTGMVLSSRGGALARMLPVFRLGAGGPLGSGRQWVSWITRGDFARAVAFLIETEPAVGPVNIVTPHPVRNAEFVRTLGRVLHRPAIVPVPAAVLSTAFGAMARATILASQRAIPRRLGELGFRFDFPLIADALTAELEPTS